jgi:hypothetical protein
MKGAHAYRIWLVLPSPAIIIEWETGLDCSRERVTATMAAVAHQLRDLAPRFAVPPETIVCFDTAQAREEDIRTVLADGSGVRSGVRSGGLDWPGVLRVIAVPEPLDYYQKKNFGFGVSTNPIVIFLDSDVIPEPDWLGQLLEAFLDFRNAVVAGRTHLETRTLYERGVALSWIFDARVPTPALRRTRRLVSNNIAFRRALFAQLPFPNRPTFRGQCSELGRMLASAGVVIYEHSGARASHPAHHGIHAFFARALNAGADQCFYDEQFGRATVARCLGQWREDVAKVSTRIAERRAAIRANAADLLVARLLGFAYYSIKAAGYLSATAMSGRQLTKPGAAVRSGRYLRRHPGRRSSGSRPEPFRW